MLPQPAAAEAADAPEAVAEPTAEAPDAPEAPAADAEAAPVDGEPAPETTTRTAEEVTGGTEQPDAKKAKVTTMYFVVHFCDGRTVR